MSEDSDSISEERSLFRPFTRESLAAIEARIAEELAKQKELEAKKALSEVGVFERTLVTFFIPSSLVDFRFCPYVIRSIIAKSQSVLITVICHSIHHR